MSWLAGRGGGAGAFASAEPLRGVRAIDRLAWDGGYSEGVLAGCDALKLVAPVDVAGFSLRVMAEALQQRLDPRASLRLCDGLGHYTTLQAALAALL